VDADPKEPRTGSTAIRIVLVLLLSIAALTSSALPGRTTTPRLRASAASGSYFDHVVVIVMENHNKCDILTTCGGTATYMTGLANAYASVEEDRYCNVNPSLPNYLCLTGGSDFGCSGYDGNPNSNGCTSQAWQAKNIVDRLEDAGLTWKAYMEDMPSNCYGSNSGNYAVRHNPFVYYSDVADNATRCARVVPAGSSDGTFLSDLGSVSSASNYMWLTPNNCNNMHSCSVATGDAYLSTLVPQILNSSVFKTQRAALFVTFDEGYGEPIYSVWAGPVVKTRFTSSVGYNHYSLLATIEANWNLAPLTTNDRDAANMGEFFAGSPAVTQPLPISLPIPLLAAVGVAGTVALVAVALLLQRRKKRSKPPPEKKES